MNKLKNYIVEQQNQRLEYLVANKIPLIIKNKPTTDIDISELIKRLESTLPNISNYLVKTIIVADLEAFKKNKTNALYYNKIIYISNNQDDINDMLDDIVHEYSHAVEEEYNEELYSDRSVEDEFLAKRDQLKRILTHQGFETGQYDFMNADFNKKLDKFLLNVVKYEKFNNLTKHSLFINPYAATSLREYFATGFEEYMLGDHKELKNISPKLYQKIDYILNIL